MLTSIKHAFRVLRKDPVFTVVAIGSLALGIGATSAMFSFADAMLLRPLPVLQPDRVVTHQHRQFHAVCQKPAISYPDYVELRDRNRSFDGLVGSFLRNVRLQPRSTHFAAHEMGPVCLGQLFPRAGRGAGAGPRFPRRRRPGGGTRCGGRAGPRFLGRPVWREPVGGRLPHPAEWNRVLGDRRGARAFHRHRHDVAAALVCSAGHVAAHWAKRTISTTATSAGCSSRAG